MTIKFAFDRPPNKKGCCAAFVAKMMRAKYLITDSVNHKQTSGTFLLDKVVCLFLTCKSDENALTEW